MVHVVLFIPEETNSWLDALKNEFQTVEQNAGIRVEIHSWPTSMNCDYAVVWNPPPELFDQCTSLKAVFSLGAGVDGLLPSAFLNSATPIVRVEDAGMAEQMVEYSLYAALHHLREFDEYRMAQTDTLWKPRERRNRDALRIGVLGLGVLGESVARALSDFGFTVAGWSRSQHSIPHVFCTHGDSGLDEVLRRSDVLIVLLPLTVHTRGLLDQRRLSLIPNGYTIVNVARGPIVEERALLAELECGRIQRAFLDVFPVEPLPEDSPLWKHPRVTVTPHIAAQTPFIPAARQIVEKIVNLELGKPISGVVNRSLGY